MDRTKLSTRKINYTHWSGSVSTNSPYNNLQFAKIFLKTLHTWRTKLTIRTERTGKKNRGGNPISMMNVATVTSLRIHTGKWWAYQASEVGIHWDSKWIDAAVKEKIFKVKIMQVFVIQIKKCPLGGRGGGGCVCVKELQFLFCSVYLVNKIQHYF